MTTTPPLEALLNLSCPRRSRAARALGLGLTLVLSGSASMATTLPIPNGSFESPQVPPVTPYATPEIDQWQKTPQPFWYDPAQNQNTPWEYLMGTFYNAPFPGQFIENCDGSQAAFIFAVPEAGLFQDYDSIFGTNTTPTHAFNFKYNPGSSYELAAALLGGGGGMQPGATFQLSLYYRDDASNKVTVSYISVTNSPALFTTNTVFVDFSVRTPLVKTTDAWAGRNIGVQLVSTADFMLAGGYWDVDNVRLTETVAPPLTLSAPKIQGSQFQITVLSEPGAVFEIQASTSFPATNPDWLSLGRYTNSTGNLVVSENLGTFAHRYYRAKRL